MVYKLLLSLSVEIQFKYKFISDFLAPYQKQNNLTFIPEGRSSSIINMNTLTIFLNWFSVPCTLSEWSDYTECPSCGEPTQTTRFREIIKPAQFGGECPTDLFQTKPCNNPRCPGNLTSIGH